MKPKTKFVRRLILVVLVVGLIGIGMIAWSNRTCQQAANGRMFRSLETVPANDVGLVLGTIKATRSGSPNPHFQQRIDAAAALYKAGKVRHLLVSGDNHNAGYDEPTDMSNALVAASVPASAITCDYAGFRTLDSVVRAQTVFGLQKFTIISEEFHCPRALWIAQRHGLDAVAFAAPDVSSIVWSVRANLREYLARTKCALDLYVWHRGPKFSGPREPLVLTQAAVPNL